MSDHRKLADRPNLEALAGRLSLRPDPDDLAAAVDACLALASSEEEIEKLREALRSCEEAHAARSRAIRPLGYDDMLTTLERIAGGQVDADPALQVRQWREWALATLASVGREET